MSDKLEALSQPVAFVYQIAGACVSDYPNPCGKWVDWRTELSCECPPDWMIEEGKVKDLKPRYSHEYVAALIQRAEAAEQKYRDEFAKRVIDEVVDADPRQIMAKGRIREISEGADVIIGEKVLLAKTALYYIEKNRDSVEAFQKVGLSLIAQQERNAELKRANAAQDDHINQQQDRVDTLEKKNDELGKHVGKLEKLLKGTEESLIASTDNVAELEQRLQQPIAIPAGFRIVPIKATREQLAAVQVAGKSVVYTDMVLAAPEHPGFKVEGE